MTERDIQTEDHALIIDRLAEIKELRGRPNITNKQIAEQLGISHSTLYRDISTLVATAEVTTRRLPSSSESKPERKPRQGTLERDKGVLSQLRTNPNLHRQELAANLFISLHTLHRSLRRLRKAGEIIDRPKIVNIPQQTKIQSRDERIANLRKNHPELTNEKILDELEKADEYISMRTLSKSIRRLIDAGTIMRKRNIGPKPKPSEYPVEDIEDPEKYGQIIADLRNKGLKNAEIIAKTGRSPGTFYRYLEILAKAGKVKRRDHHGNPIE